jgi:hypothetical protein
MKLPKITLPTFSREDMKRRAKNYLGALAIFLIDYLAPIIVITSIGIAAKLEGATYLIYLVSAFTVYWSWDNKIKRKTNLDITAKMTFVIPEGMDPEDIADLIRLNGNTLKVVGGKE